MRGLWLENNQIRLRDDIPVPSNPGEALIKVRLAGICGTDLEMVKGYYPFTGVPGHEFVGEVVSVDTDESDWIGKRVVGEINVVCGKCEQCLNGRSTHCEARSVLGILNRDGVFAKFVNLPLENLHLVPDSVSDEAAVFTEPLAAALEIQEQVQIRPNDRVLVIGAGRLGQLIAQSLALTGCGLGVVARREHQQSLLRSRGIRTLNEADIQPWRWDVVVEATGSDSGLGLAKRALRPRGTLVLKSTYKGDVSLNLSPFVVDEITVVGSRCGPFSPALRLLAQGQVDPTVLISAQFRLDEALAAFEQAARPGMMKVLLRGN
jgi:2-desacetyl-2-hydroxyethyl bacteriochlorophyllide A dehydrogenase